jgi:hypothetical protein
MTTRALNPEASAETRMQTEGVHFSVQLQHHVYYSPSNNFAHSQISDMLVKESGFDSQSV